MKLLAFMVLLAAVPAQADLYRWRDPQTGSIKFSNLPPPWYGDPQKEARAPFVEVVPDLSPRRAAAAAQATPAKPAAQGSDLDRTAEALRQQAELYRAVSAELDRQDPAGAARRRALAQQSGVLEQLKQGLEAQLSPQFSLQPPQQR